MSNAIVTYESRYYRNKALNEYRVRMNRIRRTRERKKNILLFITMILMVFWMSVSIGSFLSNARTNDLPVTYKYYASIPVKTGDTLWTIAREHKSPQYESLDELVQEIRNINQLSQDKIEAGNNIIVPYYSTQG